jgi:glycosyltransferase involved in cell wall biosynthesis
MRLTFLNPVGVVGGGERVLLAAARQVRRLRPDWPVSAVLAGDGPLAPALAALGAEVVVRPQPAALAGAGDTQLRAGGVGKLLGLARRAAAAGPAGWGYLRRLRADLRRLGPDVLHSNGLKTHFLAAVATVGLRPPLAPAVVWHLHDFYSHRPLARRLVGRLRRGVAAAVAISDAVKHDAEPLLPGVPVRVVRNAVDTDHFTPADRDGAELDRLAGLPPAGGVVRVGLVATYANWKGQDVFLDALARVEGARGYVVGGPIYATAGSQFSREELEARADRLGLRGRVGFVPFQADPADVYRMLDVVVHASTRAEPFGLTIIEAMACGKAVVVAAAGGAAELFAEGIDGLGHQPGDVAGLADAIRQLAGAADLRRQLGEAARQTAVERFHEDRFGRELVAVYEEIQRSERG